MKKSIILIISFGFIFLACEKEIKLKESEIKSRIVVNSLFEANDTLKITLSESRDILHNNGGTLPAMTGATAKLSDNSGQALGDFVHDGEGVYYLPNFKPLAGETYSLSVEKTGFDPISAKNRIPEVITISNIDTLRKADYMNIDITFTDNSASENYYSVVLIAKTAYEYEVEPGVVMIDTFADSWVCTKDLNTFGNADPEGDICSENGLLVRDQNFNGSTYTFTAKKYLDSDPYEIIVILKSISPDLYKYRTTLQNYNEVQGNPFGEPVQVFSNITDGFGIFAGQSVYADTIVLK